jgi:uncharacterized MAPEG superfamily protein
MLAPGIILPETLMELQILFCAVALGLVQLGLTIVMNLLVRAQWAAGPRDEPGIPLGKIGERLERAYRNFLETFPLFAAAVLIDQALGKSTPLTMLGVQLYIWARLIYVPLYVAGIPFVRTLVWIGSLIAILLVMSAVWPG